MGKWYDKYIYPECKEVQSEFVCPICGRFLVWESDHKYGCSKCGARFLHDLIEKGKIRLLRLPDKRSER